MFVVNNMELFTENSDMYEIGTRKSSNLHLPLSSLIVYQKGPQYLGIKVYNSVTCFTTDDAVCIVNLFILQPTTRNYN
jgi:hypothetical protein